MHPAADGAALFDFHVGGGLGRTPVIGSLIREGLPEQHLLPAPQPGWHEQRTQSIKVHIKPQGE